MANKHYVGEVGTVIEVDCGTDISAATNTTLQVRKPDGTEVEWTATIYNTNYLRYTVQADDFNQAGTYVVQASLTLSGWTGLGEASTFEVYPRFEHLGKGV